MEVSLVRLDPLDVVGIAHSGAYHDIGAKFEELSQWQQDAGLQEAPLVGIYFDDPHKVPVEKLRSIAAVIVPPGTAAEDQRVQKSQIPGGNYAMASVVGDYSKLPGAWEEFYGSIFARGHKTKAELCFERYINTPYDTPPDKLITELYAPLAD